MTETVNQLQAELVENLLETERRLSIFLQAIEDAQDYCPEDDIVAMSALELDADKTAKRLTDIDEVLRLLEAR